MMGIVTLFSCQNGHHSEDVSISQKIKRHRQFELNAFLLDKISKNRIVMIGDHEHGQGLYSRPVTNFLDYWLGSIAQDRNQEIPKKITLFLEHDSLTNHRLHQFFHSGKLMDFIEPEDFAVSFTIDRVEFIQKLREIYYQVMELNKNLSFANQVQFQISGPEKIPNNSAESTENLAPISLSERDKFSARQIIRYLEAHSDHRAIIFYGAAHLFRKPWFKSTPPYSSYLLAYYLTQKYGKDEGCYTVFQYNLRADSSLPGIFSQAKHTYALDNKYLKSPDSNSFKFLSDSDAAIFLYEFYKPAVQISQVPTNHFIRLFLDCLPIYLRNREKPGNDFVIQAACQYLQMISGFPANKMSLENNATIRHYLNNWKMWYVQSGFDPVMWTKGYQFLLNPFRLFRYSPNNQNRVQIETVLKNLTGSAPDTLVNNADEQVRVWLRYLERNRMPILTPRLIQIMSVGTSAEINESCNELQKLTGQEFQTAKEWTSWWLKKLEIVERLSH